MAERRVIVGPSARARGRDLAVRINGPDPTFRIATDRLSTRLVAAIPDRLLDLLEIAAAVFTADSSTPRGGRTRPHFGAGWRRRFSFDIGVREPAFWRHVEVQQALGRLVDAMSEDKVRFSFGKAADAAPAQDYFPFDPAAREAFRCENVLLFSGGLDSLVGAIERLEFSSGRIALVTHLSASKRMPYQTDLAAELQRRYPGRVLWLPVAAHMSGTRGRETTQRTRTLLFGALAFTAARMLGGKRVTFFENGIVSQNLPISDQVIGTMATRTTHPLVLRRLAELMSLVAGDEITIENPHEWLTKTEVVGKLRDLGAEDLIERTVSCSRIWKRTRLQPHCGCCAQCIDRRFAVLAAGLSDHDPAAGYATEVLTGPREADESKTMAVEWARHAVDLSVMDVADFMRHFGGELTRILEGFSVQAGPACFRNVVEMHRRHGEAVRGALEDAVTHSSGDIVSGRIAPTSLLAMFLNRQSGGMASLATAPVAMVAAHRDDGENAPLFPLKVILGRGGPAPRVEVRGLGGLSPAPSRVVEALAPTQLEDRGSGLAPEDHRFVPGADLARALSESAAYVRQNVKRCRTELADFFTAIEGEPPPRDLLIESRRPGGFRLEPECRVIREASCSRQAGSG